MSTFKEAHQVKLALKMKLQNFAWYHSSLVLPAKDSYYVQISVKKINDITKKHIPPFYKGVIVRTELE